MAAAGSQVKAMVMPSVMAMAAVHATILEVALEVAHSLAFEAELEALGIVAPAKAIVSLRLRRTHRHSRLTESSVARGRERA